MAARDEDTETISRINHSLLCAYREEEEYWKQKSRQLWLTLGDKNTNFFHATTRSRRERNRVSAIETTEGAPVYEDSQIVEVISQYFQQIFTSTNPPATEVVNRAITPCISVTTNETLTSLPLAQEIKEAMFATHPDKAPGPDGFSASFFQSNWDVVGPAIIKEIQSFFCDRITSLLY